MEWLLACDVILCKQLTVHCKITVSHVAKVIHPVSLVCVWVGGWGKGKLENMYEREEKGVRG